MSLYEAVNGSGFKKPLNYNLYRLENSQNKQEFKDNILRLDGNDLRLLRQHAEIVNNDDDPNNDIDLAAIMRDVANPMSNHEFLLKELDDEVTGGSFFSSLKHLVHKAAKGVKKGLHVASPVLNLVANNPIAKGALLVADAVTESTVRGTD